MHPHNAIELDTGIIFIIIHIHITFDGNNRGGKSLRFFHSLILKMGSFEVREMLENEF